MPRSRKPIQDRLAAALDRQLLVALTKGVPVLDEHGCPVFDEETGEPVRTAPSAAVLATAARRIQYLEKKRPLPVRHF